MLRRVRFIVLFAGACALALATFCACSASFEPAQTSTEELVIGYDSYRPFVYVDDNGEMAGIDAEIATEACKRAGYTARFEQIDWEARDSYLESGEVDCLWSCYSMNEREGDYAWVGPYMFSRQVVAVLNDSDIWSVDALVGKRVAVKSSTKPETIFLEGAGVPSVEGLYCLSDMNEVAAALRNRYVDAVAGHAATLAWYLESGGADYRFLDGELLRAGLGIAFAQSSDPNVRDALASALHEMRLDGTTARILRGYGLDPEKALKGVDGE